jgi:surface antigen
MRKRTTLPPLPASLLMMTLAAVLTPPVAADPPDWAPAHGYRAKHEHEHEYHDDDEHENGRYPTTGYVVNGSCNRSALGAVLGGVAGGVVGASIGNNGSRDAATIIGAVVGAMVGGSIGRSMDEADRYCTGQALEYAQDRRPVSWRNPDDGRRYVVTPTRSYHDEGHYCRDYTTKSTLGGRTQQIHGTACRMDDGRWQSVNG